MPKHIPKRERAAIRTFMGHLMGTLHMPLWEVVLTDDPPEAGVTAEITARNAGYYEATLALTADWMKIPSDQRRRIITHETCHLLHFRGINDVLNEAAHLMHDHEHDALMRRYRVECEYMVSHIALFIDETRAVVDAWNDAHKKEKP